MEQQKKPEFLYHGSPDGNIEEFEPRLASGTDFVEDQDKAVYATHERNYAIAFALPKITDDGSKPAWSLEYSNNGSKSLIIIRHGRVDKDGIGYVYKLPSGTFEKDENRKMQWRSHKRVKPESKEEVRVSDYYLIMTEQEYEKWLSEREQQRTQQKKEEGMPDKHHNDLLKITDSCSNHYEEPDKGMPEK